MGVIQHADSTRCRGKGTITFTWVIVLMPRQGVSDTMAGFSTQLRILPVRYDLIVAGLRRQCSAF